MVTVTTNIPSSTHTAAVDEICQLLRETDVITPRPRNQLLQSLTRGDIALALDDDKLVGWLVATPYTRSVQELGMAYILPRYRKQGILASLIKALINNKQTTLAVTYDANLARMLEEKWHFRLSSLKEFNHLTKYHFALSRCSHPKAFIAAVKHLRRQTPIYLVRRSDDTK